MIVLINWTRLKLACKLRTTETNYRGEFMRMSCAGQFECNSAKDCPLLEHPEKEGAGNDIPDKSSST